MSDALYESAANEPLRETVLFDALMQLLREQDRPAADLARVQAAFLYAQEKHAGQKRKNQENYIVHPVSVALILAEIPVDADSIVSGLLHDTLEDTSATPAEIRERFGDETVRLVEGVTKLGKFEFTSAEDRQAENFRRMFLAMAHDVRVVMVKLADRLHNMRTLDHMKPEKQLKIAAETLEIFAPLANRMGMGRIRAELEDMSLKFLKPDAFCEIETELAQSRDEREGAIAEIIDKIQTQLTAMGIQPIVKGRVKNYYSIYKKMAVQQKALQDIYDISALRVIVASEKECYETLGVIHNALKPIPGRFKDYVAMPKSNLYQSLHTTVIGPSGRPLEVQIRTQDMHRIAEYGIAAHWKYKEAGGSQAADSAIDAKLSWLRQMLEMKDEAHDASDYVEAVKLDLFRDEVFVFSPKGRVIDLPKGSTPVDFAYRIHTEVGHTCTGALINGKMAPLDTRLKNGDIVEIITSKKSTPRLYWINFVQTQTAKSRIRQWFKRNLKDEYEQQGRRALEETLTRAKMEDALRDGELLTIARELNYVSLEDLFAAIGFGELNLTRVINRLKKSQAVATHEEALNRINRYQSKRHSPADKAKSAIHGLNGMVHHLARCCTPVPGEEITGVITRARGVMVHRIDCINLNQVNPGRLMALDWSDGSADPNQAHTVRLEAHAIDRVGMLKDILGKIADTRTNVSNVRVRVLPNDTALVELTMEVANLPHLETVMNAIRRLPDVMAVKRQQFRVGKSPDGGA
ncbi:MAG: bifunctional (p)ppGpp synthetase/guanosine-3',5'-bis(diphosphate) 3'-pyrophosphohydrolase [Vampirovibrionales bacterium]|nr:bifunctional (p)ppGpp synthetase/guanosine-3',5'-bis(diphosphate) 3'-pyrophosphohydrolase [Vampirovibrionales bacterium]